MLTFASAFVIPLVAGFCPVIARCRYWPDSQSILAAALAIGAMQVAVIAFAAPWRYRQFREVGLDVPSLLFRDGWLPMLATAIGSGGAVLMAQLYKGALGGAYQTASAEAVVVALLAVICCLTLVMLASFLTALGRSATWAAVVKELARLLRACAQYQVVHRASRKTLAAHLRAVRLEPANVLGVDARRSSHAIRVEGAGHVLDLDLDCLRALSELLRRDACVEASAEPAEKVGFVEDVLSLQGGNVIAAVPGSYSTHTAEAFSRLLNGAIKLGSPEPPPDPLGQLTEMVVLAIRARDENWFLGLLKALEDLVWDSLDSLTRWPKHELSLDQDDSPASIAVQLLRTDLYDALRAAIAESDRHSESLARTLHRLCMAALRGGIPSIFAHYLQHLSTWYLWALQAGRHQDRGPGKLMDDWLGSLATWISASRYADERGELLVEGARAKVKREYLDALLSLLRFSAGERRSEDAKHFLQRAWGHDFERDGLLEQRYNRRDSNGADQLGLLNDLTLVAAAWWLNVARGRRARQEAEDLAPYRDFIANAATYLEGAYAPLEGLTSLVEQGPKRGSSAAAWGLGNWRHPDHQWRAGVVYTTCGGNTWVVEGLMFLAIYKGEPIAREDFLAGRSPVVRRHELEQYSKIVESVRQDVVSRELSGLDEETWQSNAQGLLDFLGDLADEQAAVDTELARNAPLSADRVAAFKQEVIKGFQANGRLCSLFSGSHHEGSGVTNQLRGISLTVDLERTEFVDGWHLYMAGLGFPGREAAQWQNCFASGMLSKGARELVTVGKPRRLVAAIRLAIQCVRRFGPDLYVLLPREPRFWKMLEASGGQVISNRADTEGLRKLGTFRGATVLEWPHWEPSCALVFARSAVYCREQDPALSIVLEETDKTKAPEGRGDAVVPLMKSTVRDQTQAAVTEPEGVLKIILDPHELGYAVDLQQELYHLPDCAERPEHPDLWEVTTERCRRDSDGRSRKIKQCTKCAPWRRRAGWTTPGQASDS